MFTEILKRLDKMPNFAKIKTVNHPRAYFIGTGFYYGR